MNIIVIQSLPNNPKAFVKPNKLNQLSIKSNAYWEPKWTCYIKENQNPKSSRSSRPLAEIEAAILQF